MLSFGTLTPSLGLGCPAWWTGSIPFTPQIAAVEFDQIEPRKGNTGSPFVSQAISSPSTMQERTAKRLDGGGDRRKAPSPIEPAPGYEADARAVVMGQASDSRRA
jgi:hypothetical protein